MNLLDAAILGIIEGLTEFLPISSTGHLILANQLLQIPETAFVKSFDIAIQLGAILAVVVLYWRQFLNLEVLKRLVIGFIPTGIIGLVFYTLIKTYLLGNANVVLWSLLLGGLALVLFEYMHTEKLDAQSEITAITYRQAFGIGAFQSIAIIPGISRSAATILGGLWLGIRRTAIVEFSFLLAVPTMLAATAFDVFANYSMFSSANTMPLMIGFITACIVALIVIRYFLQYIRRHTFIPFGIYRIIIALLFFLTIVH